MNIAAWMSWAKPRLQVDPKLLVTYLVVYFVWGTIMNQFGTLVQIAKFTYWWQVITCYLLYMVPISLLLRGLPFHAQYAYGMVAMAFCEFGGYTIKSSYAYDNNLLDAIFGIRNFSLSMTIFFALYFPLGNWGVGKIHRKLFGGHDHHGHDCSEHNH